MGISIKSLLMVLGCVALSHATLYDPAQYTDLNPQTTAYLLPTAPKPSNLLAPYTVTLTAQIANNALLKQNTHEFVFFDGETSLTQLNITKRLSDYQSLTLEIPYLHYTTGILDPAIQDWHDTFGPTHPPQEDWPQRHFVYQLDTTTLSSQTHGIGDLQLTLLQKLPKFSVFEDNFMQVHLKTPTGNADRWLGTNTFSLAIDISNFKSFDLASVHVNYFGLLGSSYYLNPKVFGNKSKHTVLYMKAGLQVPVIENITFITQIDYHTHVISSTIAELNNNVLQGSFGLQYNNRNWSSEFLFIEDLIAESTSDASFSWSLTYHF